MADIFVGSVSVGVVPDAREWNTRLRSELVPGADSVGKEIGSVIGRRITENLGIGKAVYDSTVAGTARIAAAGTRAGTVFAAAFKLRIESALKDITVTVNVDADTAAARAEIDRLSGQVTERVRTTGGGGAGSAGGGAGAAGGGGLMAALGVGALALTASGGLGILPMFAAAGLGVAGFGALAIPTIKSISTAMTQLSTDTAAYNRATTAAGRNTALAKIKQDLDGLTPGQREVVKNVQALQTGFNSLAQTVAPLTLAVFNNGIKLANALLPDLMKFAIPAGEAIGILVGQMIKFTQTQGFKNFVDTMSAMSGPAIIAIGDAIGHLAIAIGKFLLAVASPGSMAVFTGLVDGLAGALTALGSAYGWLTSHVSPSLLHDIGIAIVGIYTATKLWAVAQAILDVALNANPIGLIIVAVAALAFAIYEVVRHWNTFKGWLLDFWHWIVDVFNMFKPTITQIWNAMWDQTVGIAIRLGHNIEDAVNHTMHGVAVIFDGARHEIAHIWDIIYNNTIGAVIHLVGEIANQFISMKNWISGFFHDAISWLYNAGRDVITGLWNGLRNVWSSVTGWISGVENAFTSHFFGAVSWLYNAGSDIVSGLWNGIKDVWNTVKDWFGGLPHDILHALGIASPPAWSIDAGKFVMEGILKGLAHGATDVKGFFVNLASSITGPLKSVWSTITKFVGGGGGGASQWAGVVQQALALLGLPSSLAGQVLYQIQTESGGNPNAINTTDINAQMGDPSRGLLQTIGATFAAYHVATTSENIYDPLANVAAAINYAAHVYGPSLMRNGMGLGSGHGYDSGGWLPPGFTLAYNGTGRHELVLTADQLNAARRGSDGSAQYVAHFDSLTGAAIEQHVRVAFSAMLAADGQANRQGRRS